MIEDRLRSRVDARETLLAAATGLHLAVLQFAHVFLLETRLTGRASVYFTVLLFWLLGFLAGLNGGPHPALGRRAAAATAAYYLAWLLLWVWPYRAALLPVAGLCAAVAGAFGGAYFASAADRGAPVGVLAKENHAFLAGLLACTVGAAFAGRFLLDWAPLITGVACGAAWCGVVMRR